MLTALITGILVAAGLSFSPLAALANTLNDNQVTLTEISGSLTQLEASDPQLLLEPVASDSSTTLAADTILPGGTRVSIPWNPGQPVTLSSPGGNTLQVTLPHSSRAQQAQQLSDGTVVFPAQGDSANSVIPGKHGVQMLTTIASREASTRYSYDLVLQSGQKIELLEGGGARIVDAQGVTFMLVAPAWARDALGQSIPTRYEVQGSILTQVVDHTGGSNIAYPVVADPFWIPVAAWVIRGISTIAKYIVQGLKVVWKIAVKAAQRCWQSVLGNRHNIFTLPLGTTSHWMIGGLPLTKGAYYCIKGALGW